MSFPPIANPVLSSAWISFVAILAVCCAPVSRLSAQSEPKKIVPKFGTQAFQGFLAGYGLQPLKSVGELKNVSPKETLIVVLGKNDVLADIRKTTGGLDTFLENGGALLVATDQATGDRLNELGVQISGETVREFASTAFLKQSTCPMIRDFKNKLHPLSVVVTRGVATNMPSYVQIFKGNYRNLATFSANTYADGILFGFDPLGNKHNIRASMEGEPFLVGSPWNAPPAGRVLVMGGHGVFMNLMMHFKDDNDNSFFARQCVDWLAKSPLAPNIPGRLRYRRYVLFVEKGRVSAKLDGPIGFPPIPVVRHLNNLLHGWEKENFFNRLLHRNVPPYRIWQAVILLTTLWLLFWGARRLIKARFHLENEASRLAEGLDGYPTNLENHRWDSAPLTAQRHRTQQQRGNYWDALHQLARHFFIEFASFAEFDADSPQPFDVKGKGASRNKLLELWELAVGREPRPISARVFRRTVKQMDELARRLSDGTLVVSGLTS